MDTCWNKDAGGTIPTKAGVALLGIGTYGQNVVAHALSRQVSWWPEVKLIADSSDELYGLFAITSIDGDIGQLSALEPYAGREGLSLIAFVVVPSGFVLPFDANTGAYLERLSKLCDSTIFISDGRGPDGEPEACSIFASLMDTLFLPCDMNLEWADFLVLFESCRWGLAAKIQADAPELFFDKLKAFLKTPPSMPTWRGIIQCLTLSSERDFPLVLKGLESLHLGASVLHRVSIKLETDRKQKVASGLLELGYGCPADAIAALMWRWKI